MYYCSNLLCNSIARPGATIICSSCFSQLNYGKPELMTVSEIPFFLLQIKEVTENGTLKVGNVNDTVEINL